LNLSMKKPQRHRDREKISLNCSLRL